jgi:UDP-2,3-diacylglucosamine pyrophosphatase LpxH
MLFCVDSRFGRGGAPRLTRDFQKFVEISEIEDVRVILVGDMNVVLRLDKNLVSGSLILVSPASVGGFACS